MLSFSALVLAAANGWQMVHDRTGPYTYLAVCSMVVGVTTSKELPDPVSWWCEHSHSSPWHGDLYAECENFVILARHCSKYGASHSSRSVYRTIYHIMIGGLCTD
jgi:hypothetical protein